MSILLRIKILFKKKKGIDILKYVRYLFLVLITIFFPFSATPQVTADFMTLTSTIGCGSLIVEFKDLSTGGPTSWLWDFGNGNTSTFKNPIAIYNDPGIYDVSLQVADSITNDVKYISSLVKVHAKPVVEFQSSSQVSGCIPLETSFEGLSSVNTSIVSWYWDFGDGGFSILQNPDYTYFSEGNHSVSLSVVDVNGCQNLITETDLVEAYINPVANFSADITFSCDSSELITFANLSSNASVFFWDFGDGLTSSLFSPSHIFSEGNFSISLISSEGMCSDTLVMPDLIKVMDLTADFSVDSSFGCEGLNVNFHNLSSGGADIFFWQFGNGLTSILQNPSHVFDSAGIYDVSLTVGNTGQCTSTAVFSNHITIFAKPVVSFSTDTTLGCSSPFAVSFYDSTLDATSWNWDFGDGNSSTIKNPSNIYTTYGSFDVSLLVENNYGCISSFTYNDYIKVDEKPAALLNASSLISCVGDSINFFDLSSFGTNSWHWDFGDGSFSNVQHPVHQYLLPGIYDITLTSGLNFCKDTLIMSNYIKVIEPAAIFEEVYNCFNPLEVKFVNLSVGSDNVFWDFGDGNTSNLVSPVYTFQSLGVYSVSLSVENTVTGCTNVLVKQIEITQPIASFDYLINTNNSYQDSVGCIPKRVHLNNTSQDWHFYQVFWSDGYIGYSRDDHLFTDTGSFDVSMIVTDIHGCKDTSTIKNMFRMYDAEADFAIANISGCDSLLVGFTDESSHISSSVLWDFGDGVVSLVNNPHHVYYDEGCYDVTLYTKSIHGCKDTLTRLQYINFKKPEANFTSNIQHLCKGEAVLFTNLSVGSGLSSFWSFGDGSSSSLLHPSHDFSSNGSYDVSLLVVDSFGCNSAINFSSYIQVLSPEANFSIDTLSSNCPPVLSNFFNLSSSDADIFKWDFGDNGVSILENPSHLFSSAGVFDVSLIVENSFGCIDTLIQNGFVDMLGLMPIGNFELSDTLICKSDQVYFYPTVINTDYFFWDFGNGSFSTDSMAIAVYSDAGIFTPSLIIENSSGCKLTVSSDNMIYVDDLYVDAGVEAYICKGESIELDAFGNGLFYNWMPSAGLSDLHISNPEVSPDSSTIYFLEHSNALCSVTDSVLVNVYSSVPVATFYAENFCEQDTVLFFGNSGLLNSNVSYVWSFGETEQVIDYNLAVGSHNIFLEVENLDNSCKDTAFQQIIVFPTPIVDFLVEDEVCLEDSLNFINNSSTNIIECFYNFGDSLGFSFDQNPTYTYASPGVYSVLLNVASDMGCEANIIKEIVVHELPQVDFLVENNCKDVGNVFVDVSSVINSNITSIEYDFGDGSVASDSLVHYFFTEHGIFDVKLTVATSKGCSGFKIKSTEVFAMPVVDFSASKTCVGEAAIFHNLSYVENGHIISSSWNFGLEDGSLLSNTTHTFSHAGLFEVGLTTVSEKGCESALKKKVEVNKLPLPKFDVDTDFCFGDEVEISYLQDPNFPEAVKWNYTFGDGNYSYEKDPVHVFSFVGSFDVGLEVTSLQGCKSDTIISKSIQIHFPPVADFDASAFTVSELDSEISFYNTSKEAETFLWIFNDEDYSYEEHPVYYFNGSDIYNVSLIATNTFGCSAEIIKTVHVYPDHTIFIPDAFTPNGDNDNDVFLPKGNNISFYKLEIFNKWGSLIFESESIDIGWNGKDSAGGLLEKGVYIYSIVLNDSIGGFWAYNGDIKLIR